MHNTMKSISFFTMQLFWFLEFVKCHAPDPVNDRGLRNMAQYQNNLWTLQTMLVVGIIFFFACRSIEVTYILCGAKGEHAGSRRAPIHRQRISRVTGATEKWTPVHKRVPANPAPRTAGRQDGDQRDLNQNEIQSIERTVSKNRGP